VKRSIVVISGLFGFDYSPLKPHLDSIIDVAAGRASVLPCDWNSPAVMLPFAGRDEIIAIGHSFGVSRLFRDCHMLQLQPVRIRAFCIDGVQAWTSHEGAIDIQPNPMAQIGRPAFYAPKNVVECHSWRRHIDPIAALFPLALSSQVIGDTTVDTVVENSTDALTLLGGAFFGPVGTTVAQLIGGTISHNSICAAVMPAILKRLAELFS
jgi:hypothetical protein